MLIEYLRSERFGVRGLAHWHLKRLAPEGKKIAYNPNGTPEEIARGYAAWKKLIPSGKLPPKVHDQHEKHDGGQQVDPAATAHSAACTRAGASGRARRAGAPTRWRRSDSEINPPSAIATAPSQIHGTSGL